MSFGWFKRCFPFSIAFFLINQCISNVLAKIPDGVILAHVLAEDQNVKRLETVS